MRADTSFVTTSIAPDRSSHVSPARSTQISPDRSTHVAPDRIELIDSLYGSERAVAEWAGTPAGRATREVTYLHGTSREGRDADIARAFGDRYRRVRVPGPDAHNRAVRDFMGR